MSPLHIFITGVVLIACFLLQQNLVVRAVQTVLFAVLAVIAGKRIRWAYFAIMLSTITIFNLLTPLGEVLATVGPFPITRGALHQGLLKGLAIPGLVFISLFAVQPELRLPGRFGGLVASLFYYFERLLDGRKRVKISRFTESIDELLLELTETPLHPGSGQASPAGPAASGGSTTPLGYAVISMLVVLNLAAVIVFGLN